MKTTIFLFNVLYYFYLTYLLNITLAFNPLYLVSFVSSLLFFYDLIHDKERYFGHSVYVLYTDLHYIILYKLLSFHTRPLELDYLTFILLTCYFYSVLNFHILFIKFILLWLMIVEHYYYFSLFYFFFIYSSLL